MSSGQTSSDDFPSLVGADNIDVWKAHLCVALDGKRLRGFATKPDYDGFSEDDTKDSGRDMSADDDPPKSTPAKTAESDSEAVDYDESDDNAKPQSGSDDDLSGDSGTAIERKDLSVILSFNRRNAHQARKLLKNPNANPLNQRERRHQEVKTKAFLMNTMSYSAGQESRHVLRHLPLQLREQSSMTTFTSSNTT